MGQLERFAWFASGAAFMLVILVFWMTNIFLPQQAMYEMKYLNCKTAMSVVEKNIRIMRLE